MRKELAVMILGAWTALVPFLGFPRSWDEPLLVLTGFALVIIGIVLRTQALHRARYQSRRADTFAENTPAHDRESVAPIQQSS